MIKVQVLCRVSLQSPRLGRVPYVTGSKASASTSSMNRGTHQPRHLASDGSTVIYDHHDVVPIKSTPIKMARTPISGKANARSFIYSHHHAIMSPRVVQSIDPSLPWSKRSSSLGSHLEHHHVACIQHWPLSLSAAGTNAVALSQVPKQRRTVAPNPDVVPSPPPIDTPGQAQSKLPLSEVKQKGGKP